MKQDLGRPEIGQAEGHRPPHAAGSEHQHTARGRIAESGPEGCDKARMVRVEGTRPSAVKRTVFDDPIAATTGSPGGTSAAASSL
jgi:hypothetical protein